MTPCLSKFAFVAMAVGWFLIRYKHARKSRREPILKTGRGFLETLLMLISLSGLGILPLLYLATGVPRLATYSFRPTSAWLGIFFAMGALVLFRLTHRALGRNWSVSLDVRKDHRLVTDGIYRKIRHPMYAAFWLWAVAQVLLLPNWVAGFAGVVGFGTLFFGRIFREERLMLETFGEGYREYMNRTSRVIPWLF